MTTHSASTIALAPDSNICKVYELEKNPTRINEILDNQGAIDRLSEGLILVSPKMKYVLVEGKIDPEFYNLIFRKLTKEGKLKKVPLIFVQGNGRNNVEHWVSQLSEAGLGRMVAGIVDGDNKKEAPTTADVHPLSRYCIENYLIDPIVLYWALIPTKFKISIDGLDLEKTEEGRMSEMNNEVIQKAADETIVFLEQHIANLTLEEKGRVTETFCNGRILEYPKWLFTRNGKEILKELGNNLTKGVFQSPKLLEQMLRCNMIPLELEKVFQKIQEKG